MARYRHKSEEDLRWNRIRRRLTRELDIQVADAREEILNNLLAGAWTKYTEALSSGTELELESEYEGWIGKALKEHLNMAALEPSDEVA